MIEVLNNTALDKLKAVELDMLKCFIDICDKLALNYFVVGGTLLGAVRHKGFIPWDDDIDVGMLRKDYDVFLREAPKYLPNYYSLQCNKYDKEYPYNFAKIRDSRTTFIESCLKNKNINHGVFIDIFPYDFYPEKKLQKRLLKLKYRALTLRIVSDFMPIESSTKSIKDSLYLPISKVLFPDVRKAVVLKEKVMTSIKESKLVINFCGAWGDREIAQIDWVKDICKLPFEDIEVSAPIDYDSLLKHVYGNYHQLPPVEKQVTHHYTEVIDLDNPYTTYVDKMK